MIISQAGTKQSHGGIDFRNLQQISPVSHKIDFYIPAGAAARTTPAKSILIIYFWKSDVWSSGRLLHKYKQTLISYVGGHWNQN